MGYEGNLQTANQIARKSDRYWLIEYLKMHKNIKHKGYVLSSSEKRDKDGKVIYEILLPNLGAQIRHSESGSMLNPGDDINVIISEADPRSLTLLIKWEKIFK
mmetsp:Transcript_16879/g.24968  ORF Transcript_16879/g.24968 Transcript_16879/m.24968 type:complete len:103 (+) Transcript_16879:108-416(+)